MKIKPWKILKALGTLIGIANELHDQKKALGKSTEDFVKEKILNPATNPSSQ